MTAFVAVDESDGQEWALVPDEAATASRQAGTTLLAPATRAAPALAQPHHSAAHRLYKQAIVGPVTNSVSWRCEGIRYRKNEVFLDIIERLSYFLASDGSLLSSQVQGALRVKSLLSGMPEIKLGLNDKLPLEMGVDLKGRRTSDIKFHQCVRLARLPDDKALSFIPPDGDFELMSYHVPVTCSRLPIRVKTVVTLSTESAQAEYVVYVKALFKPVHTAQSVHIRVPLPKDASGVTMRASHGSSCLPDDAEENIVVWQMDRLPGLRQCELTITFDEPPRRFSPQLCGDLPVVGICFKLPGMAASGLQAHFMKIIEKSGYEVSRHIHYLTEGSDCRHRL